MRFVKRGNRGKVQHKDRNRLRDGCFAVAGEKAREFRASEGFICVEVGGCIVSVKSGPCCLGAGGCEGIGDDGKGEEGDIVFLRKTEGS